MDKLLDPNSDVYLKANIDRIDSMEFSPGMESEWIEPLEQDIKNRLNSQYYDSIKLMKQLKNL